MAHTVLRGTKALKVFQPIVAGIGVFVVDMLTFWNRSVSVFPNPSMQRLIFAVTFAIKIVSQGGVLAISVSTVVNSAVEKYFDVHTKSPC
jgi:uncharacterized protein (DUF4213/DUF364 family)